MKLILRYGNIHEVSIFVNFSRGRQMREVKNLTKIIIMIALLKKNESEIHENLNT